MTEKKPIKLNDQQLMLMASNVADLYHQLSNDLFDNVVDRLKERGTYYLEQQPYLWQLEKMNDMGMLNDINVGLLAEYSGIAEEQIRHIIENEGYKVYTDTMEQLGSNAYDKRVMEDLISYSNQAIKDVNNLINTTLPKSVQVAYKDIVEKTVAKVVTGLATPETALNETIMQWHAKGFYGYTDAAGRRQRADSYARTIIRTTVNRVNNEMRTRPAEELGIDTFYYGIKSAAREMCAYIQGKIVTKGEARTEAGHKIYSLLDYGYGRPEGCQGINCTHPMTPFVPGVNYLPEVDEELKDLTPEQAIENANVQAKQRQLERNIRFTKEQIHVAEKLGDVELIDRYKMKLGRQKTALKAYLDQHPFLYRDRARERYQEDPLTFAKEEIRQRTELKKKNELRSSQPFIQLKKDLIKVFAELEKHDSVSRKEIQKMFSGNYDLGKLPDNPVLGRYAGARVQIPSHMLSHILTKHRGQVLLEEILGLDKVIQSPDILAEDIKGQPNSFNLLKRVSENRFMDAVVTDKDGQVVTHFMMTNAKKGLKRAKKIKSGSKKYDILDKILYNEMEE